MSLDDGVVNKYKKINASYKKTCICHIGIDAGFFSEYIEMVEVMMYCLENRIKFKLYSEDANFGYKKGWTDYFEPFCEEVTESFHHKCNFHSRQSWRRVLCKRKMIEAPTVKWKIKLDLLYLYGCYMKFIKGDFDYYTYEIADKRKSKKKLFELSDLNFRGNYLETFRLVDSISWHFNNHVFGIIRGKIKELNLPKKFIACQIRGGDKNIEYELLSPIQYVNTFRIISPIKDVFVLTDDYRLLQELCELAPDYRFYSLCQPDELGYYNRSFSKSDPEYKKARMLNFFTSIEILRNSYLFVGTFTSMLSKYIANIKWPCVEFVDLNKTEYLDALVGESKDHTFKLVYK